jgi:predicted DsbA family dithiol-disulfide isomerase
VPKSSTGFLKQAAQASEFAAAHGKFWEMHAQLFTIGAHDLEHLLKAASAAGLDAEACSTALTEHRFAERVRELSVASVQSGIIGTPTLFINGAHYENRIEEALLVNALSKALQPAAG